MGRPASILDDLPSLPIRGGHFKLWETPYRQKLQFILLASNCLLFISYLSRLGLFSVSDVQAFNSKHVYTILILSDQDQSSYDHNVGIISLNRFVNAINLYQIILLYTFYVKSFPHYEFALPLNQDLTFVRNNSKRLLFNIKCFLL